MTKHATLLFNVASATTTPPTASVVVKATDDVRTPTVSTSQPIWPVA
jgi:hypothetical protein